MYALAHRSLLNNTTTIKDSVVAEPLGPSFMRACFHMLGLVAPDKKARRVILYVSSATAVLGVFESSAAITLYGLENAA